MKNYKLIKLEQGYIAVSSNENYRIEKNEQCYTKNGYQEDLDKVIKSLQPKTEWNIEVSIEENKVKITKITL